MGPGKRVKVTRVASRFSGYGRAYDSRLDSGFLVGFHGTGLQPLL